MPITKAQLRVRKKHIGSSDLAAIMGFSQYRTATDVWRDKMGLYNIQADSPAITVGNYTERGTLDWAIDTLKRKDAYKHSKFRKNYRRVRGYFAANLDAITYHRDQPGIAIPIEAKSCGIVNPYTERLNEWGPDGTDQVPDDVIFQVHHQMICTGAKFAWVAALLAGRGFALYKVKRNHDLVVKILATAGSFWKHVVNKVEPNIEAFQTVKPSRLAVIDDKTVPVDVTIAENFVRAKARAKEWGKLQKEAQEIILEEMGDANHGTAGRITLTRSVRKRTRKVYPDSAEFETVVSQYETLTAKEHKDD